MRRRAALLGALLLLPLTAFGPAEHTAGQRWAVIVGITDYIHFEDAEGGDLPGAERDARAMRDVLVGRYGFAEENVHMLLNREATRAAIESELTEWLPSVARPGDQVVFYFAGHGSQVWDDNGDEDDGLDETIVPADVDPMDPSFDIVDEELGEWLRALPTTLVSYVHDNCNGGTGTRAVTPFSRARVLARDVNELPGATSTGRRALPGQDIDMSGMDLADIDILEIAASQANQAAVDAYFQPDEGEPFHGGAFTTYLVQQLWRAPEDASYLDIFENVREAMKQARFEQDPFLSEDSEMVRFPLFFTEGGVETGVSAGLPIVSASGATVELGAGMAFGLTKGSILETDSGARMRVTATSRDRATAEVVSGSAGQGERARLVAYAYVTPRLLVNVAGVDSETQAAVGAAAAAIDGVEAIGEGDAFAHLLLDRRGTEVRVLGQDGFTRHTVEAGAEAQADMDAILRKELASMRLSDMENLGQQFEVEVWMEDRRRTFGLGETITFNARSDRDGYLTLVDLGTDGTVTVLFPNPYESDTEVRAGQTITFPSASMDFEIQAQPPVGRGMVRAFVTPAPLDLDLSEEEFTSGDVAMADRVVRALFEAAGSEGTAVALDTWGTSVLVYDITR